MNKNFVRILIAEWVPSLNKGELAILYGILKTFEEIGNVNLSIFSFLPSLDKERYPKNMKIIDAGKELYLRNPISEKSILDKIRNFIFASIQHFIFIVLYRVLGEDALKVFNKPIWRAYCKSNVIVICHDQVDCVNGFILNFSPLYITLLARALRKPIVIYGNGTSGFRRKISKILALYVLNNVSLITVREESSFLYLKNFVWNKKRIHLTSDPAVLLLSDDSEKIKSIMSEGNIVKNGGPLVGVALSREVLLNAFNDFSDTSERYKKAIAEVAKFFDDLIERVKAKVVFIPHCIEPYHNRDDRVVARDIYAVMKNKHRVHLLTKEYSPGKLKGLMGEFDLLISSRIHAAIGALSMGVPSCVLASPSDRRAHGLIGKMFKQTEWIYNVNNLDAEKLTTRIADLLSNSDEIREDLISINKSLKESAKLNGKLLKNLLASK
jgi:polysaccharide pyruvyl transferase WcaK-like protein